jgi:ribonuclease HI
MGCGVVICHAEGPPEIVEIKDLGLGTNNVAEWTALILAMDIIKSRGYNDVCVKGDSMMVVKQALGEWKVNGDVFVQMRDEFQKLSKGLNFTLCHVPRALNLAGIYLEKGSL